MKRVIVLLALLAFGLTSWRTVSAQELDKLEFAGAWQHISGSNGSGGLNGLGLGAFLWLNARANIGVTYDTVWNTSTLTITQIGSSTQKTHLQNWMIGPRVYFMQRKIKKFYFDPFGEVRFGGAVRGASANVTAISTGVVSNFSSSGSDDGFSWQLGGGADYVFNPHVTARFNLDFLRTHFVNAGQSHVQVGLGIGYTFGQRSK